MTSHVERYSAADLRRRTPRGELKTPKFVKFEHNDTAANLDEIFWTDPMNFTPYRAPSGAVRCWGVVPMGDWDHPDADFVDQRDQRVLDIRQLYKDCRELPKPELQFVNALMEKKIEYLGNKDLGDLHKQDYLIEVYVGYMPDDHQLRRNVRVSGGLSLSVFSDKILKPLFGITRNTCAHIFTDFTDGALLGPKDCSSPDTARIHYIGYAYIPDTSYMIAHLVQNKGDTMGYHCSFSKNWDFVIKVLDIKPVEESTGAVAVLSGQGAHVPHDVSFYMWQHLMTNVDKGLANRREALRNMYQSRNYSRQTPDPNFDFDFFPLSETQEAVKAALNSKASIPSSSKQLVMAMTPSASSRTPLSAMNYHVKKGQKIVRTVLPSGAILEEGVSTQRRDDRRNTACYNCGNPNDLRACSGCMQKHYCSESCQKAHWKQGHKNECKK